MNIPALSMAMAQVDVQNSIGVAMLSKSMDQTEDMGAGMVKMMEQSVTPHLGSAIDVSL